MAAGVSSGGEVLTPTGLRVSRLVSELCRLLGEITDAHGELREGKISSVCSGVSKLVEVMGKKYQVENMSVCRLLGAYYLGVVCDAQVAGDADPFQQVPDSLRTTVNDLIKHLCSGGENLTFWLGDPTSIPFAYHPSGPPVLGRRLTALGALSSTLV